MASSAHNSKVNVIHVRDGLLDQPPATWASPVAYVVESWRRSSMLLKFTVITAIVILLDHQVEDLLPSVISLHSADAVSPRAVSELTWACICFVGTLVFYSRSKTSWARRVDASRPVKELKVPKSVDPMGQKAGKPRNAKSRVAVDKAANLAKKNEEMVAAAKEGQLELVEALLDDLIKSGMQPDIVSYNAAVHACAKTGAISRAETWLSKMRAGGIEPNTITYNIVMNACAQVGKPALTEEWLNKMIEAGVAANDVTYATLIHAHAKHGEPADAERILRKMISDGVVEPNIVAYNSMIYSCSTRGDAAGAETWLAEAEARGLEPRVTTYTAVVDACAKALDVDRAEKWMARMVEVGVEPNVVTYSAMVDACAKIGNSARAEKWHQTMIEAGVKPNAPSFSALVNACAKAGEVDAAMKHLDRMKEFDLPVDVVVFACVLDACAKQRDAQAARRVFQQMPQYGVEPNVVAYASLACTIAHRGEWQEVEHLAWELSYKGLVMNEYFLYALLISYACATPKQGDRAEAAFRKAVAGGIAVNKHVFLALVRAVGHARAGNLEEELCGCRRFSTELLSTASSSGRRVGGSNESRVGSRQQNLNGARRS